MRPVLCVLVPPYILRVIAFPTTCSDKSRPIVTDDLSCDPRTLLPTQKRNHTCNVLRLSQPVERAALLHTLERCLALTLMENIRPRGTRRKTIDIDAFRSQVLGHGAHHLIDRSLSRSIQCIRRRHRRRTIHARANAYAAPTRSHMGHRFLCLGSATVRSMFRGSVTSSMSVGHPTYLS